MYPPLPTCDPRQAGETLPEYAARVLRHLLSTDCTATLTTEQLAQADTAACRAAAQLRDDVGRASRLDPAQLSTLETLSAARHTIATVIAWRHNHTPDGPLEAASAHRYAQPGSQGGRPAPLLPPRPGGPGSPDALPEPRPDLLSSIRRQLEQDGTISRRPVPADGIRF